MDLYLFRASLDVFLDDTPGEKPRLQWAVNWGRRLRQRESETSPCVLNFHEAVKNRLTPFECTSFWPWQYFIGHVPVKTEGQVCWGHSISSWWRDARAPLGKQPCNIPAKQKVLLGTSFSSYWKTTSSSLCKLMGKELDYKPTEYCSQPLSPSL